MSEFDRELFERAFSAHASSCRRTCKCGKEFYDAANSYSWEDGELERLEEDPKATSLPYAVSIICFEGADYVADCDCWVERAKKIAAWLEAHDVQVATWLNTRKGVAWARAEQMPEVKR